LFVVWHIINHLKGGVLMKKVFILLVAVCFFAVPLTVFAGDPVNVASKGFTEQVILGKIMVNLLKDRGIPVKDRTSLGGTNVNREALMSTWNIPEPLG
jgi:glycine betaine/choline ABC-type transport system substrate-binding protein